MSSGSLQMIPLAKCKMDGKQGRGERVSSSVTAQLSEESRRMEERLQMLREVMRAEKASRESCGGICWQSGAKGPLTRVGKKQNSPQSTDGGTAKKNTPKKPLKVRLLTGNELENSRAPRCGQCENTTASLSCVECSEKYCTTCFAKFHQKGALTKHHVRPLVNKSRAPPSHKVATTTCTQTGVQTETRKPYPATNPTTNSTTTTADTSLSSRGRGLTPANTAVSHQVSEVGVQSLRSDPAPTAIGGSLLEGTYDEAASAASFQEALEEWRAAGRRERGEHTSSTRESSSMTTLACSTQTPLVTPPPVPADLHGLVAGVEVPGRRQQTGVSYLERLVVRRNRTDPSFLSRASQEAGRGARKSSTSVVTAGQELHCSQPMDWSQPSQYNIFYGAGLGNGVEPVVCDVGSDTTGCDHMPSEPVPRPPSTVTIEEVKFVTPSSPDNVASQPMKYSQSQTISNSGLKTKTVSASKKESRLRGKASGRGQKPKTKTARSSGDGSTESTGIAASIRSAWTESKQRLDLVPRACLSSFFLSGVAQTQPSVDTDTAAPSNITREVTLIDQKEVGGDQCRFASTVWLPENSVTTPDSDERYESTRGACGEGSCREASPYLDRHGQVSLEASVGSRITERDSDSEESDGLLSLEEGVEREGEEEEEEEDCEALEELAWELASMASGRDTQCGLEVEGRDEDQLAMVSSLPPNSMDGGPLQGDPGASPGLRGEGEDDLHSDLERIMSEFELEQQYIIDHDSS